MNWDQITGNWNQLEYSARARWRRLTSEDLQRLQGHPDELVEILTARYGYSTEEAEREIDGWARSDHEQAAEVTPRTTHRASEASRKEGDGVIEPDADEVPGTTNRSLERGWGEVVLGLAGVLVFVGTVAGVFFLLPLMILALVGLALVPLGTRMIRNGRSRGLEGKLRD